MGLCRSFGLSITVNMPFMALLECHLRTLARTAPQTIGVVSWGFFVTQRAGVALSFQVLRGGSGCYESSVKGLP
jgi:hypothetical protein